MELCKDYSSRGRDKKNISRINYIISQIVQAFSRPYIWTVESKLYAVKTSNIAEESFLNKCPLPQVLCILLQLRIYTIHYTEDARYEIGTFDDTTTSPIVLYVKCLILVHI